MHVVWIQIKGDNEDREVEEVRELAEPREKIQCYHKPRPKGFQVEMSEMNVDEQSVVYEGFVIVFRQTFFKRGGVGAHRLDH